MVRETHARWAKADMITLTSIYPVKSKDPITSSTVPTLKRNVAKKMALHGTFGGGLIN